ncbi:MAG: OmpA family protein [Sphingobacteriales bacterium]|nr:MAG: OmpA family protein [Sphingobacteriales bacterium]
MKRIKLMTYTVALTGIMISSCHNTKKSTKGAIIGGTGGAILGRIIGNAAGNKTMGTIIGAAVGGTVGTIIGNKMDKQAEEISKEVPNVKVERVGEGIVVEFNSKILFGFDKSDLTADAKKNLDDLVTILNKYPDTNIEIQGHTDNKGTEEYNQGLSERRASAVAGYLSAKNIANSRISTKGYGKTAPKYSNATEEGQAQNRRVEFLITANEKMKAEAAKEAEKSGKK